MANRIQARMVVEHVQEHHFSRSINPETREKLAEPVMEKYAESFRAYAVYSNDPDDPNYSFAKATPNGQLQLFIENPSAWGFFEQGKAYLITIENA